MLVLQVRKPSWRIKTHIYQAYYNFFTLSEKKGPTNPQK